MNVEHESRIMKEAIVVGVAIKDEDISKDAGRDLLLLARLGANVVSSLVEVLLSLGTER